MPILFERLYTNAKWTDPRYELSGLLWPLATGSGLSIWGGVSSDWKVIANATVHLRLGNKPELGTVNPSVMNVMHSIALR